MIFVLFFGLTTSRGYVSLGVYFSGCSMAKRKTKRPKAKYRICVACGGSKEDSTGSQCHPCQGTGRYNPKFALKVQGGIIKRHGN